VSSESSQAGDPGQPLQLPDCGQRISVESPHQEEKLWTQMIGFKPGAYLILEKPIGVDAADGMRALCEGDPIVIRFLKDGNVFGFRTPILRTLSVPYKLLFVAYPVDVVRHSLRSSPRLQCYLPCDGQAGDRPFSRAFIRDFSSTGCQLRIPLDALADDDPTLVDAGSAAEEGADLDELELHGPAAAKRLTINLHLPGEDAMRVAEGDVLDWQTLPRYHVVRVRFDEPQLDIFEQLSLYTTQLG
jgi:hypothetical protein